MIHEMKLDPKSFEDIKNKSKTIEVRLYDKKRQKLQVGDSIAFHKLPTLNEVVTVKIMELQRYPDREELIRDNEMKQFGRRYASWAKEEYIKKKPVYSQEEIDKYGVLAIHLQHT